MMSTMERRQQQEARRGFAVLAMVALAFSVLAYGAASIDASQGMTVGQSLQSAGL